VPDQQEGGREVTPARYARKYQHVIALALTGKKRSQIADELGLTCDSVGAILLKARRRNLLPPAKRATPPSARDHNPIKREAESLRLACEGVPPREIAVRLGCQPSTVYHYLWKARREGNFEGRFKTGTEGNRGTWSAQIPRELAETLRPMAEVRGMTLGDLARSVLSRVAEDNLVDAVLDDHDEEEAAHA
jgi:DNA-binding CsgD family transcriptional regulator